MSDDPSNAAVLRADIRSGLSDKSSDRRKQAAHDIEVVVRSMLRLPTVPSGLHDSVSRLIRCLEEEFCQSPYPTRRKGGLLGLSSIAIALENKLVQVHVSHLVPPTLVCFSDEDVSVRYSACEAFFNLAKVARGGLLPHITEVFDALSFLYSDVDQAVKDGSQCLDRLIRDIVTECRDFDYPCFIPMLTARIRVPNPSVRQLALGWVVLLDSVPQVDMIVYLPNFLEGLFSILASDQRELRQKAEHCLSEFLEEVRKSSADRPGRARRVIAEAASTVARSCRAGERRPEDNYVRLTALHWIQTFVKLQVELEGTGACEDLPQFSPAQRSEVVHSRQPTADTLSRSGTLAPTLETQACRIVSETPPRWTHSGLTIGRAKSKTLTPVAPPVVPDTSVLGIGGDSPCASGLRHLLPVLLAGALHCLDDGESGIRAGAEEANRELRNAAHSLGAEVPVEDIVDVVLAEMDEQERSNVVVQGCLSWALLLFAQCPGRVLRPAVRDRLLDAVFAAIPRSDESVALTAFRLLARLVEHSDWREALPGSSQSRSTGASTTVSPKVAAVASDVSMQALVARAISPSMDSASEDEAGPAPAEATSSSAASQALPSTAQAGGLLAAVCRKLFRLLAEDPKVFQFRGELAVRLICQLNGAERFYTTATRAIFENLQEQSPGFAPRMVRILNRVLLTSREAKDFRAQLRKEAAAVLGSSSKRHRRPSGLGAMSAESTPISRNISASAGLATETFGAGASGDGAEPRALPVALLRYWFHCPVSTLALCLWLHWFELADAIVARLAAGAVDFVSTGAAASPHLGGFRGLFGQEPDCQHDGALGLPAELETQLDELVELIESPVFMNVRLHILMSSDRPALLRVVCGLASLRPRLHGVLAPRLDVVHAGLVLDRLEARRHGGQTGQRALGKMALAPAPAADMAGILGRFDCVAEAHGWRRATL